MKEEQPGQAKSKPKPKASSKVRREYRLEPGSKAQEEEGSGRTVQKNGDMFIKIPQSINALSKLLKWLTEMPTANGASKANGKR